jgi:acetylglutamate synthase
MLTFPTQEAALAIAGEVQPLKVIWLRPEGGLRTRGTGEVVRSIDLCRDAPHLVRGLEPPELQADFSAEEFDSGSSAVSDEEEASIAAAVRAEVVREALDLTEGDARSLVELADFHSVLKTPSATVSVTAPEHLAQELVTHKGAGTLITRGERIISHSNLLTLDVPRLNALISAAFGASLPEGYLEGLAANGRIDRIYVSEGYRGAAVVLHAPPEISLNTSASAQAAGPINYLDKFAVDPSAQGDKLGEVLWRAMTQREHKLYWRSRSSNRVNPWYYEQSHGCYKENVAGWTVFWRNLAEEEVMGAIRCALAVPPTFPHRSLLPEPGLADKAHPETQPQLK